MRHFSPPELHAYLQQHQPLLIDVREPWEFAICQIEGSQLIPMRQIPSAMHELNPEQETVVICHHGIRSKAVCEYLEQAGFNNLINLSGGVDGWAKQVDPNIAVY